MGGYRDEREAERARIEALERDLADAQARAERAEAEVASARARATAVERGAQARATPAEGSQRAKKSRAERKRDRSRRTVATAAAANAQPGSWPDAGQRRYRNASFALSLVAYLVAGGAVALANGEDAVTRAGAIGAIGAIAAILVGHAIIGLVTRAPGVFNGAMITLIASGVSLAGAMMAVVLLEDVPTWLLSGSSLVVARYVGAALALLLGSLVTAHWSSDAASSASTGHD